MTEKEIEQVALFRYGLFSPVINGQTSHIRNYFTTQCDWLHEVLIYGFRQFSEKPLWRWLHDYRVAGFERLKPGIRDDLGKSRKTNPENVPDNKNKTIRPIRLVITLQGYWNRISIGKDVIRILGAPSHICLRVTEDNSLIALAPCEALDLLSFKVPDALFTDHHCIFRICSKQFVRNVMATNGMNPLQSNSFDGIYSEKQNAIMFMLRNTRMES